MASERSIERFTNDLGSLRQIVLDTASLIYFIEGVEPYTELTATLFRQIETGAIEAIVPAIVEVELLVKPIRDRNEGLLQSISIIVDGFPNLQVMPLTRSIGQLAARIRADQNVPIADAIILATAANEGCDAVIGNDSRLVARGGAVRYLLLDDYIC
ncbi:MAG TPA: PIN domain-containing protein [Chloroflexota bacterium]|nr:PIN domain-containing protein [Chloroflexota bacterium]